VRIWCNGDFGPAAMQLLGRGVGAHTLVLAQERQQSVLAHGRRDSALASAEIAFGQPDPADCLASRSLRWIEVSTAGYTRYDNDEFREAIRSRGIAFTNTSQVYADACAEQLLAMMLADCRRLLPSYAIQLGDRGWQQAERRAEARLLAGSTVVMLGFGSIGRRLAQLLGPFPVRIFAVRRSIRSEPGVHVVPEERLSEVLAEADHVVDVLPENDETRNYVNARRISCMKPGARFYNVGRGATVDQEALVEALVAGRLGAAHLDVTTPEPLPPGHPLWGAPNCYVTPHMAGGRSGETVELVRHFLANLAAFETGAALVDRVM
jgi:phosphoglycerate dehydrogenase-like enzyme